MGTLSSQPNGVTIDTAPPTNSISLTNLVGGVYPSSGPLASGSSVYYRGAAAGSFTIQNAVADALSGLDQALMKSAQASQLALQELAAKSREFSDSELKQAIDQMKKLESDFIAGNRQGDGWLSEY